MRSRWLDPQAEAAEPQLRALRPQTLEEFVGQEKIKERLRVYIQAAKARGEPLDHVLLLSPPGLGKTTLAHIIAREMGVQIKVSSGPALERPGDLAAILTHLSPGDILFVDEIHRLHPKVEEILYPAMEDWKLPIVLGEGPHARCIELPLAPFTLIGATTREGLLTTPLRDRFEVVFRLEFYTPEELAEILGRAAPKLGVAITPEAARVLGGRARGTPRIALRLLRRARDVAQVRGLPAITAEVAHETLRMLGIDEAGLDELDRRILSVMMDRFDGGPVGLETLSAALGEDPETIAELYEPYLIALGFIRKTPQGRVATERAYAHLGRTPSRLL
ncbi:MAG: Holliday junction branch migration DNA helicase RuvB [Candidatus Bipolaricaulota bacterium]|nr:Holliday junction branch migration DNA helicase RuvB [Candidatus Bipolaricaulota bacterium]MCX7844263.1 Holliday junction branch migration DNA helicase RuvB [Candidatus Bipolaricaulota bacterium]MDW8151883.1 Holliday junction branch migration DNA helicase RuvB [Candidatus Bipolaricaulota bacterium]